MRTRLIFFTLATIIFERLYLTAGLPCLCLLINVQGEDPVCLAIAQVLLFEAGVVIDQ